MAKRYNIKKTTHSLVILGLLTAITFILSYTPLGMVPLFFISATICHVPVILAAILEGPVGGVYLGLVLGVISMVRGASSPQSVLDPFFANPLVSVIPRVLVGLASSYAYQGAQKLFRFQKKITGKRVAFGIAGCVGSLVNTFGTLLMLYIIYAQKMVEAFFEAQGVVYNPMYIVLTIITTNGLVEMIVAALIVTAVTPPIVKLFYQGKARR